MPRNYSLLPLLLKEFRSHLVKNLLKNHFKLNSYKDQRYVMKSKDSELYSYINSPRAKLHPIIRRPK